jgi:hypothetical protein
LRKEQIAKEEQLVYAERYKNRVKLSSHLKGETEMELIENKFVEENLERLSKGREEVEKIEGFKVDGRREKEVIKAVNERKEGWEDVVEGVNEVIFASLWFGNKEFWEGKLLI